MVMMFRSAAGFSLVMLQAESFAPRLPPLQPPLWRPLGPSLPAAHATPRTSSGHRGSRRPRTSLQVNPDGLDALRYCLSVMLR